MWLLIWSHRSYILHVGGQVVVRGLGVACGLGAISICRWRATGLVVMVGGGHHCRCGAGRGGVDRLLQGRGGGHGVVGRRLRPAVPEGDWAPVLEVRLEAKALRGWRKVVRLSRGRPPKEAICATLPRWASGRPEHQTRLVGVVVPVQWNIGLRHAVFRSVGVSWCHQGFYSDVLGRVGEDVLLELPVGSETIDFIWVADVGLPGEGRVSALLGCDGHLRLVDVRDADVEPVAGLPVARQTRSLTLTVQT